MRAKRRRAAGSPRRSRRPRRRQQTDLGRAEGPQRLGARRAGRAGRQHVVDQQDASRRVAGARERSTHCLAPGRTTSTRLRPGIADPPQERRGGDVEARRDGERKRLGLVVAPRGEPPAGKRNPRHGLRHPLGFRPDLDHRRGEGVGDRTPAPELQPVDRPPDRTVEPERRPGHADRVWWAVGAALEAPNGRCAASLTPWRRQRHDLVATRRTERPRTRAAARAPCREQRVQQRPEHARTLAPSTDIGIRAAARRARPAIHGPGP